MQDDGSQETSDDTRENKGDSPAQGAIVTSDTVRAAKKKTYKLPTIPKKTVGIVLIVLVVAALGFGAYWYNTYYRRTTAHNSSQVITKLKKSIVNGTASTLSDSTVPPFQPAGYSFLVRPASASVIKFTLSSDKLDKTYQKAQRILYLQGLAENAAPGGKTGTTADKYYQNAYIHCSLTTTLPSNDWVLQVACADNIAYVASARQMKQFHDLYVSNNPAVTGGIAINQVDIQNSSTAGYKTAQAFVSYSNGTMGVPAYYYQTPDSTWHYFRASPVEPYCTDFNTPDLKKAYLGQACYDPASASATVAP